jgi:hypothetical protein
MLMDLIIMVALFGLVIGSVLAGLVRGRRVPRERRPENEHLGTIQGAFLGLLGLLLGFAFAGAMARFVDRQDRLASEANAIKAAFDRAELLPDPAEYRANLSAYARERLALFHEQNSTAAEKVEQRLDTHYHAALGAAITSAIRSPQFALLIIPGVEAIDNELSARNAITRRHLPTEFIFVMIACSCVAMYSIGFGVGIAERRSVGTAIALACLVATTIFVTLDFDRPQNGLIRLDPSPLEDVARQLAPFATAEEPPVADLRPTPHPPMPRQRFTYH